MIAGEGMIHYEAQQNAEDVKKGKKKKPASVAGWGKK